MHTDPLFSRVRTALDQQQLLRQDAVVVVAVSGGPDSLCLLHLLWRMRAEGGPALHVAHLDHSFRGAQAAAEARFVGQTAHAWGLPATIEQRDVPAISRATRQNVQATARAVRYAFLAHIARAVRADAVAVAHQADDQAETVLLHLLRGAGPAGLRGMRAVVPWHEWSGSTAHGAPGTPAEADAAAPAPGPPLIRPLLTTSRTAIDGYCAEHGLTPQHDPSNASPYYARSRIRTDLLPHLTTYNPQISAALTRTAQICADDYTYIQSQLAALWPELAAEHPGAVRFQMTHWKQTPPALQRYALRRAALYLIGSDELSYDQVEAGRAAATHSAGYQHTLGRGLVLQVERHSFLIVRGAASATAFVPPPALPQLDVDHRPLTVPGTTPISSTWWAVTSMATPAAFPADHRWRWWVALDSDALDGPLILRRRRAGDRFRPVGGPGSRRLQDFFVDQKLPRALRNAWPLLTTPTSIVWVAGLRADARFQATANTRHTLWVMLQTSR